MKSSNLDDSFGTCLVVRRAIGKNDHSRSKIHRFSQKLFNLDEIFFKATHHIDFPTNIRQDSIGLHNDSIVGITVNKEGKVHETGVILFLEHLLVVSVGLLIFTSLFRSIQTVIHGIPMICLGHREHHPDAFAQSSNAPVAEDKTRSFQCFSTIEGDFDG